MIPLNDQCFCSRSIRHPTHTPHKKRQKKKHKEREREKKKRGWGVREMERPIVERGIIYKEYVHIKYFKEMYWNLEYIFKIVRHAHPAQHQTTLRPCPRAPFLLPLVRLFPWNMHQSSYLTKIFSPVLIDADESVMSTFACIASALMHCSGVSDYVFGY